MNNLLLLFCLTAVSAAASLDQNHLADLSRSKRKTKDVSTSAIEYMRNLRDTLADEDGRPVMNDEDPTEVWAMQDRDILHEVFREKPTSTESCTAVNRFYFNWKSMSQSQQNKVLLLEKGILRAHLQVIPRLMNRNGPTQVSINVYMKLSGSNSSGLGVHAGSLELSLTPQSGGWMELNVTEGIKSLWPLPMDHTELEVTILTSSACQKRASVYFDDPTSISLSQAKRRQRLYALQPLLLVFLSDEVLKEVVKNQQTHENYGDDITVDESTDDYAAPEGGRRRRRQTSTADNACQTEDFYISFTDLNLQYVLAPTTYNARRCAGSCNHQTLDTFKNLGNNHAKIMASAAVLQQISPGTFARDPKEPCCVPTRYGSLTIITPHEDMSLKYVVYPNMVVQECMCR